MNELKQLKKIISEKRKAYEKVKTHTIELGQRRDEIMARLAEIAQQLTSARGNLDEVGSQYVAGQVAETEIDIRQNRVTLLESRERYFTGLLSGVEGEIAAARGKQIEASDQVKDAERAAWSRIERIELATTATALRRALVAHAKFKGTPENDIRFLVEDFFKWRVKEACFLGEHEPFGVTADRLDKEYF